MAQRTSLEQQLMAVQSAARILRQKDALNDAARTLTELARVKTELTMPEPDADKVSDYLVRIFAPDVPDAAQT